MQLGIRYEKEIVPAGRTSSICSPWKYISLFLSKCRRKIELVIIFWKKNVMSSFALLLNMVGQRSESSKVSAILLKMLITVRKSSSNLRKLDMFGNLFFMFDLLRNWLRMTVGKSCYSMLTLEIFIAICLRRQLWTPVALLYIRVSGKLQGFFSQSEFS